MTSDQPPSSGTPPPGGKGRRRPPTIDLTANEFESQPVTKAAAAPPPEPAVKADDAPPTAPAQATEAGSPEPQPQPTCPIVLRNRPRRRRAWNPPGRKQPLKLPEHLPTKSSGTAPPRVAWLPPGRLWPALGAGVAGGIVVLIGLGIAGLVTGRDTGVSALDGAPGGLEQRIRDVAARPLPAGGDPRALDEVAARLTKLEAAVATPRPATPIRRWPIASPASRAR